MQALVNIGLVLQKIHERGWHGFSEASAHCRTSPNNFKKLSRGELPRLDALQRICRGLGITESELIVGTVKPKPTETAQVAGFAQQKRIDSSN
jgi:hypothetical protein